MADPSSVAVVAFVTSWVTPMSLFLFLNLMIGTLVLSSRFSKNQEAEHRHGDASAPPRISRAPSLLNRVRSFNFAQYCNFDHQQYSHQHYTDQADHHAPPLARVPSVVQRLKSLKFTQFKFDRPSPAPASETVHYHGLEQPEYTAARANDHARPPPLLQRLKSINFWQDSPNPEPRPDPVEPPPLARVPSFLARVKSINFSLYGQQEYTPEEEAEDQVHVAEEHHISRVASDTKPSGGEAPAKLPKKMRKSASHKSAFGHFGHEKTVDDEPVELRQRPESVREGRRKWLDGHEEEEEEQIDSKADDFINKFRQELKLQRMDSIVRYKEMLTRAHAAH